MHESEMHSFALDDNLLCSYPGLLARSNSLISLLLRTPTFTLDLRLPLPRLAPSPFGPSLIPSWTLTAAVLFTDVPDPDCDVQQC